MHTLSCCRQATLVAAHSGWLGPHVKLLSLAHALVICVRVLEALEAAPVFMRAEKVLCQQAFKQVLSHGPALLWLVPGMCCSYDCCTCRLCLAWSASWTPPSPRRCPPSHTAPPLPSALSTMSLVSPGVVEVLLLLRLRLTLQLCQTNRPMQQPQPQQTRSACLAHHGGIGHGFKQGSQQTEHILPLWL